MMAASVETHVQSSATLGDEAEPQSDDDNNEQSDSEGEENNNSEDYGESDGEVGGESDGEEAEDEDGGDGEDEQEQEGEEEDGNPNAGWAEAMANILGKKTPDSQNTILVKNKQLDKIKEKERLEQLERQKQMDKKRTWEMLGRQKPDLVKDRESERALQRIATRGVVQLFNAVRKHQKTIDEKVKEVGGSERKKAKILSSVSKKDFIDVLRQTDGGSRVAVKKEKDTKAAADDKPAWSVLRDDYMMGATMKDWDKDSDKEEGDAGGQAGDSGSD